jgi:hypothetical protein
VKGGEFWVKSDKDKLKVDKTLLAGIAQSREGSEIVELNLRRRLRAISTRRWLGRVSLLRPTLSG